MSVIDFLNGMAALALCIGLYFLPAILGRKKRNVTAIFTLNLLLGWTVIGWVVALVWALTVEPPLAPGELPCRCGEMTVALAESRGHVCPW
jgi:hypothetical protein